MHIDLLKGRVWLVPTLKAATAQSAAHNFAVSVFRDVRLPDRPDVLVSNHNLNSCGAFWLNALSQRILDGPARGWVRHPSLARHTITSPINNTTSKVEHVNGCLA